MLLSRARRADDCMDAEGRALPGAGAEPALHLKILEKDLPQRHKGTEKKANCAEERTTLVTSNLSPSFFMAPPPDSAPLHPGYMLNLPWIPWLILSRRLAGNARPTISGTLPPRRAAVAPHSRLATPLVNPMRGAEKKALPSGSIRQELRP